MSRNLLDRRQVDAGGALVLNAPKTIADLHCESVALEDEWVGVELERRRLRLVDSLPEDDDRVVQLDRKEEQLNSRNDDVRRQILATPIRSVEDIVALFDLVISWEVKGINEFADDRRMLTHLIDGARLLAPSVEFATVRQKIRLGELKEEQPTIEDLCARHHELEALLADKRLSDDDAAPYRDELSEIEEQISTRPSTTLEDLRAKIMVTERQLRIQLGAGGDKLDAMVLSALSDTARLIEPGHLAAAPRLAAE